MAKFKLVSDFKPTGDQPQAIKKLAAGLKLGLAHQVLLGVTGSGKTFTMANVIEKTQRPTLVISHNKTLAAQLFQEFRDFFPENAVEYFVSYYDYYQPEAYLPHLDQYIAKEVEINQLIDKLRLSATTSLLTRRDVIVVASVSCIYNLGSPAEYERSVIKLKTQSEKGKAAAQNSKINVNEILPQLVNLHYNRSDYDFRRSTFRVRGDIVDVWPSHSDEALRVEFGPRGVRAIKKFAPVTGDLLEDLESAVIYPAKHYMTAEDKRKEAIIKIKSDLKLQVAKFRSAGKLLEAHRLEQRTGYDLELIAEMGYCPGIENYSRYFDDRPSGEPPYTLLDYFPQSQGLQGQALQTARPGLAIIDESHITVPQLRSMYKGDRARKETLVEYGFRLPSCLDNRPLKFNEFLRRTPQVVYTSATPGDWEIKKAQSSKPKAQSHISKLKARVVPIHGGVVEQLIRPTGLLDPEIEIRKTKGQVADLVEEIQKRAERRERVLVTTLTKRMAEELASYLEEKGIKVRYLHADIKTLKRPQILEGLRRGNWDVVVGINLLREGLDLPEVSLVVILDADKEGFLRSQTSLIQTMGRAARHVRGRVIMYADNATGSMKRAIAEIERRRKVQLDYNRRHRLKPKSIVKPIRPELIPTEKEAASERLIDLNQLNQMSPKEARAAIGELKAKMLNAAKELNFERAAKIRDLLVKVKRGARDG